jgi:septum site-determining protein MinC
MPAPAPAAAVFDLKSTAWTLTALRLHSADVPTLAAALHARFADSPGLFEDEPVVIDLSPLREAGAEVDWAALLPELRRHGMLPIAAQGGSPVQLAAAGAAGLAAAPDAPAPREPVREAPREAVREVVREVPVEVLRDVVREVEVVREVPAAAVPVLIVDKPLRSGQQVYARGGDLVVLAVVSFGAEVIADGSIHVYAPLRGRAVAGARGDTDARIFSTCMEPQLVSIAGTYRTLESALPADVQGRPAQVRLDGDRLVVEALKS